MKSTGRFFIVGAPFSVGSHNTINDSRVSLLADTEKDIATRHCFVFSLAFMETG